MAYYQSHTVGFLNKDLSVVHILPTVLLGILVILTWRWMRRPAIPTINSYSGDITLRKAHAEFISNARGLIKEGIRKVRSIDFPDETRCLTCMLQFNGPFRIITTLGSRVILPASYTEWLKNCSDLDHQALVHDVCWISLCRNDTETDGDTKGILCSVSWNGRTGHRHWSQKNPYRCHQEKAEPE